MPRSMSSASGFDPDVGTRAKDDKVMRFHMCTLANPARLTTLGRVAHDFLAIGIATDIETSSVYFDSWDLTTPETECNIYRGTFDVALYASQVTGDPYGDYYPSTTPAASPLTHSRAGRTSAMPGIRSSMRTSRTSAHKPYRRTSEPPQRSSRSGSNALVNEDSPLYYRFEPLGSEQSVRWLQRTTRAPRRSSGTWRTGQYRADEATLSG